MNEVAPCILCGTPTRSRGVLIPTLEGWQTLAALGVIAGDALAVPLCIRHRMSARLPDRVAAAVLAKARRGTPPRGRSDTAGGGR